MLQSMKKIKSPALMLVFLALFFASFTLGQETQLEQRVFEIARDLRCPVCTSESVADSNADIAIEMREIIQEKLIAGESEQQINAFFQERYGDWIMLEPPKRGVHLFVWLLPAVVALVGVTTLIILIRNWTSSSKEEIVVDAADLKRVREALDNT